MVIEAEEEKERLQITIQEQQPKVEFVDEFINSTTLITIRDASHYLGIRQTELIDFLIDHNYITHNRMPESTYGKQGKKWFLTASANYKNSKNETKTNSYAKFTTLGLYKIGERLLKTGAIQQTDYDYCVEKLKNLIGN
jgi:phage antirepressor YoqD-like protein